MLDISISLGVVGVLDVTGWTFGGTTEGTGLMNLVGAGPTNEDGSGPFLMAQGESGQVTGFAFGPF